MTETHISGSADDKIWNAAVAVVALVAAPDAETAMQKLRDRIKSAGLDTYEFGIDEPGAFESEEGVIADIT